jgi:hypothetical protein
MEIMTRRRCIALGARTGRSSFVSSAAPRESRKVMRNPGALQRFFGPRVGRDVFLYSIARTPERDPQTALRRWAARHGAGPGWSFRTGDLRDVERLRRGLGASPTTRSRTRARPSRSA